MAPLVAALLPTLLGMLQKKGSKPQGQAAGGGAMENEPAPAQDKRAGVMAHLQAPPQDSDLAGKMPGEDSELDPWSV